MVIWADILPAVPEIKTKIVQSLFQKEFGNTSFLLTETWSLTIAFSKIYKLCCSAEQLNVQEERLSRRVFPSEEQISEAVSLKLVGPGIPW